LKSTFVQGFLLMEALLAILLMTSFSIIAGYYLCSMSQAYVQNKQYMDALDFAITTADKIAYGQTYEMPSHPMNLKIQHREYIMPRVMQGPILSLPQIELVTMTIAWKGMPEWQEIKLSTIATAQA
jgi:hypothetical protein